MLPTFKNPVTRAFMRYNIRFVFWMLAYAIVLCLSRIALERHFFPNASPTTELLIAASPVVPIFFVFLSFIRLLFHVDEFLRQQFINTLAIAGGITAFLSVAYGLIENGDTIPRPSAWWTWGAFMGSWAVVSILLRLHRFISTRGAILP